MKISNIMKTRREGAELFHACWQTDGPTEGQTDK